ncbi:hypothetical protein [Candidatus Symbiopectobacterium sp.]|nr:hypothetical protein [Candidatus Symbiopectobacterium sp.]
MEKQHDYLLFNKASFYRCYDLLTLCVYCFVYLTILRFGMPD